MMKFNSRTAAFCFLAIGSIAETHSQTHSNFGELIVTNLVSAPFPHPQRASGHNYGRQNYPVEKHYQDSAVAIFIPKGYQPGNEVNLVVHFHGWRNHLEKVLSEFRLIEQFAASGRNAILIVPQGPHDSADSFGGKLEDADGFKRFISEVMTLLAEKVKAKEIGSIVLSGHSGGYKVISSILARGGLTAHVKEVYLFDALYGQKDRFVAWFEQQRGKLILIYTADGGTLRETENLITDFKKRNAAYLEKNDSDATPEDLKLNRLIFLSTKLGHNEVVAKRSVPEFSQSEWLVSKSEFSIIDRTRKMQFRADGLPYSSNGPVT